jgi:hypothetical protein
MGLRHGMWPSGAGKSKNAGRVANLGLNNLLSF